MKKQNFLMRLFHQFLAWQPISWLMARILHHADTLVLRLSSGKLTIAQISGLPIIELTTTGAKTGRKRTLPLTGLPDGDKYALIASNFGQDHHPGWYYNLKAQPQVEVERQSQNLLYHAHELSDEDWNQAWRRAVNHFPGYAAYRARTKSRAIPIFQLLPR